MFKVFSIYEENLKYFYKETSSKKKRREFSQFFTPLVEARKMVEDIDVFPDIEKIKILEPSVGYGILVLVLLEKIFSIYQPKHIDITIFDIECELLAKAEKSINSFFKEIGYNNYTIIKNNCDFLTFEITQDFHYIISNPPYKKIKKQTILKSYYSYLNGQPNLYHLFIVRSLQYLQKDGLYILISPKNFLSGKYCQNIRKFIFSDYSIIRLHTFNTRNRIFGDNILQEMCITHFKKSSEDATLISYNGDKPVRYKLDEVVSNKETLIIETPRDINDYNIIKKFNKFPKGTIGKEIFFKPGKVVQFRIQKKESTLSECSFERNQNSFPLLITHHIKQCILDYKEVPKKAISIKNIDSSNNIFIPNSNYVILRKNIEKTSDKLITSVVYTPNMLPTTAYLAIDNNLGYFTNLKNDLTLEEVLGIFCIINSIYFDVYYRAVNCNHTINSYELASLNFPSMETIKEIGAIFKKQGKDYSKCSEIFALFL